MSSARQMRIYPLPVVPLNVGDIPVERDFDLDYAVSRFPKSLQARVRTIGEGFVGRQQDALSVLLYAKEQKEFDSYAQRLENPPRSFAFVHPDLMLARTDVTAFFMRLYADLGIARAEQAEEAENQIRSYGIGIRVFPKRENGQKN